MCSAAKNSKMECVFPSQDSRSGSNKKYFLRVIPTLNHYIELYFVYSDIVSDTPSGSTYGIFVYSGILLDILCAMYEYSDILFGIYSDTL